MNFICDHIPREHNKQIIFFLSFFYKFQRRNRKRSYSYRGGRLIRVETRVRRCPTREQHATLISACGNIVSRRDISRKSLGIVCPSFKLIPFVEIYLELNYANSYRITVLCLYITLHPNYTIIIVPTRSSKA